MEPLEYKIPYGYTDDDNREVLATDVLGRFSYNGNLALNNYSQISICNPMGTLDPKQLNVWQAGFQGLGKTKPSQVMFVKTLDEAKAILS